MGIIYILDSTLFFVIVYGVLVDIVNCAIGTKQLGFIEGIAMHYLKEFTNWVFCFCCQVITIAMAIAYLCDKVFDINLIKFF